MDARSDLNAESTVNSSSPTPQDWVTQYGDRTSAFASLHAGIESFPYATGQGGLRYSQTARAWVLAGEPLTPIPQRTAAFLDWAGQAQATGRRALAFPVSEELADDICHRGGDALAVGQEPIFELAKFFGDAEADPLQLHPRARALKIRGALRITELSTEQVLALDSEIAKLHNDWLGSRSLSRIENPAGPSEKVQKRHFAAFAGDRLEALLSAIPLAGSPLSRNWYFANPIWHPDSRAGTLECLEIEAMRILHTEGAREVRLGFCPFTQKVAQPDWRSRLLGRFSARIEDFFGLSSAREFKEKMGPTRWTTLYAASPARLGLWALHAAAEIHLGPRPIRAQAYATVSKKPLAVLQPFLLLGLFLWFTLNGWTSLQLLMCLMGGFWIARATRR